MIPLNLTPEIETVEGYDVFSGGAIIKLSDDFQKMFDIELNRLDCVKNFYFEDSNHCRVFTIKDTDKFCEDLQKLEGQFKFEMITPQLIESMKQRIQMLCEEFVYGHTYEIRSYELYKQWDKEKYNLK